MKTMNRRLTGVALLALAITLGTASLGRAQVLLEQLQASNYNASSGLWTATVGSNATADTSGGGGETIATLVTGATPNGSSAVGFSGTSVEVLTSAPKTS
jgi:hypothetical protein